MSARAGMAMVDHARQPRGSEAWLLALFIGAFAVLGWPWLSGAVTVPWDAKSQFLPQQMFLSRALASGESPFWTPNVFAGWPQIADPQSLIFSPFHLLLAWLVPDAGFRMSDGATFAALLVGGVGILLLFRERGWHSAGALVAALAFSFGGSCAARIQHTGQVLSVAYLPLAIWLLERALARRSWAAGAAAGLAAGVIALGRDQVALLCLYVLFGFVAIHVIDGAGRIKRLRGVLPPLVIAAIVAGLVAGVPIALTTLLADASNRPAIDLVGAGRGSLHPAHLLTWAFADLFGAADPKIDYWGPPSLAWGETGLFLAQNMGQLYAGAVPLVAALTLRPREVWASEVRPFVVTAGLVLAYALGWYTPVFSLFYAVLPGVDLFRRPADASFVLGALVAVLGGYGAHCCLHAGPALLWRWVCAAAAIMTLVAVAAGLAALRHSLTASAGPLLHGAAWLAAALGLLWLTARVRPRPALAALLLSAFVTADLAWNNAPNESTGLPPTVYDALRPGTDNETVALLRARLRESAGPDRRDRVELSAIAYHWPNLGLAQDFDSLFGQNPLRLRAFSQATGVGDTVAVPDQRGFAPLLPSYRSTFADLFGLRFVATGVPIEQIDPKLRPGDMTLLARTRDAFLYENPRALPRVMLVTDWRPADFAAALREGAPDFDPRRTVLLEQAPQQFAAGQARRDGTARIARYTNTRIDVDVEAPDGGLLLLNDVWHSWWRAELDGQAVAMLKANVLFRAVVVPPGRARVRFTFHPFSSALSEIAARAGVTASRGNP